MPADLQRDSAESLCHLTRAPEMRERISKIYEIIKRFRSPLRSRHTVHFGAQAATDKCKHCLCNFCAHWQIQRRNARLSESRCNRERNRSAMPNCWAMLEDRCGRSPASSSAPHLPGQLDAATANGVAVYGATLRVHRNLL